MREDLPDRIVEREHEALARVPAEGLGHVRVVVPGEPAAILESVGGLFSKLDVLSLIPQD